MKLRKQFHSKWYQKIKVFVDTFNKINASLIHGKPQNITERN